ncbi:hypothetical protein F4553_004942 [Allocatelliglobosispora scoriae]|uniref:Uncharacterized protein n=1 Tax=Allocatelliglobosispora scoriae TaxID=643052 RepID=A0A841BXB3_9ACTN|nr:hypothetical protein [Allocatelliglobosispora scoriae]MBB5871563.1 hypothetical protein [Allocatelliglobosispora scoriae]
MKKHSTDVLSLVFGLVFVVIATGWLLRHTISIELPDFGWFVAGGLIVVGLIGLAGALRGSRK